MFRSLQGLMTPTVALVTALLVAPVAVRAQTARPTGLEVGGVPAINFDADEGFGYGAIAELYQYGDGDLDPYLWTLQPTVFLTTEGRRDFTLFFDAPHLLASGWRVDAFLGSEKQISTPYYGLGNASAYEPARDDEQGPDPYFYRFGRTRRRATFTLQHGLGDSRLRALFGAGFVRTMLDPVPEDAGTTLFAQEVGDLEETAWSNYVRTGLIWDSRDRETGPRNGVWTEVLIQRVDEALGADASYTRWTVTDRRYFQLSPRLVFAHRYLLQGVTEGAPEYDLFLVQTSFKQQEGLGGAKTVRGVRKNRFVGRGLMVWNAELRWRAIDFRFVGRSFHTVLSVFVDQGRVWEGDVQIDELLTDLHRGFGGGAHVGMGENFTVAVDAGTSAETGLQLYIGLGYLY